MSTATNPEAGDSRPPPRAHGLPGTLASDDLYRLLFELLPCSVVLLDAGGHLLDANPSFCRQIGYRREELIGQHVSRFSQDSPQTIIQNLARLLAGELLHHQVTNLHKDGSLRYYELRETAITLRDGSRAILAISDDVTDRLQAEREKLEIERQLLNTEKLKSLGVMAEGIAHTFNNLLGATLGNLELARLEAPPHSPVQGHLAGAVKATRNAADLTRQMLAFSGHGRLMLRALSINEAIAQMVDLLKVSIPANGTLELELGKDLPLIEADAGQVPQILIQLVTNASESLPRGPGFIRIKTHRQPFEQTILTEGTWQGSLPAGDSVALEVRDSGCGMDASTRARLFEPFFTTKFLGRGLGMAALLGIVRGHRGAIRVLSQPGAGTAVTVFFPALPPGTETSPELPTDESQATGAVPSNLVGAVLLVEDEPPVRAMLENILRRAGLVVHPVATGEEALRLFQQRADKITFVLLDLALPGMDGWQVLTELRRLQPGVKVVLTSGHDLEKARERAAAAGALATLQKPCEISRLLRVAGQICQGKL